MDLNLVLLCGRLVAPPDTHMQDGVTPHVRYLVGVKSHSHSTINVIPVTVVEPTREHLAAEKGDRMWFAAWLERRFITGADASRLEVFAKSAGRSGGDDAHG